MKIQGIFVLCLLMLGKTGFADALVIENQTSYPSQETKISIQWANSAKEANEANQALMSGSKLDPNSLQTLNQPGKIKVTIPKKATCFRVLVWSHSTTDPDFVTNWVDVVSDKTYTLQQEHLVPLALMSGTGC